MQNYIMVMKNEEMRKRKAFWVEKVQGKQKVKDQNTSEKLLRLDEIHYIEKIKGTKSICLRTGVKNEKFYYKMSLNDIEALLPPNFLRIHRSVIINVDKIEGKQRGKIICMKHDNFGVGVSYQYVVNDFLNEYYP